MAGRRLSVPQWSLLRRARYPNEYVWFVFVSALDLMLTWVILLPPRGGDEVNWLPRMIINRYGMTGVTVYKFALVSLVIVICEMVGRRRRRVGRWLARAGVALTAAVVGVSLLGLIADALHRTR